MAHAETLLFPDSGPEFVRALKTALLYSDRVHAATVCDLAMLKSAKEMATSGVIPNASAPLAMRSTLTKRLAQYESFVSELGPDLMMLKNEGALSIASSYDEARPLFQSAYEGASRFVTQHSDSNEIARVMKTVAPFLSRAFSEIPPGMVDLMTATQGGVIQHPDFMQMISEDIDRTMIAVFGGYLLGLLVLAERGGLNFATWLPQCQDALWTQLSMNSTMAPGGLQRRRVISARLSQVVLEKHLPSGDDLTFESILQIRGKHKDELHAFRAAVDAAATQIDLDKPDVELQIHDIVAREIEPKLFALRAEVRNSRFNALSKLGRASKATVSAVVSAGLALYAGGPIVATVAATLGLALPVLVDAAIDERKALASSQWALLLRLGRRR
jgi:hypothetical protein